MTKKNAATMNEMDKVAGGMAGNTNNLSDTDTFVPVDHETLRPHPPYTPLLGDDTHNIMDVAPKPFISVPTKLPENF